MKGGRAVNTSQVECFVRVAETLNFQQAAETLHISQPSVSKQIAALEDELGARLFVRTTRTVSLTDAGELFLTDARSLLKTTYHARQVIAESRQDARNVLRIGYTDTNELPGIVEALGRLREAQPAFHPMLAQDSWDANLTALQNGQIDLCFAFQDNKQHGKLKFLPLTAHRFRCVLPATHPLAGAGAVSYAQLEAEPQVVCVPMPLRTRYYSGENAEAIPRGGSQRVVLCGNASEAYALVLAGFGYCLLPEHLIVPHPDLRVLRWDRTSEMVHGVFYADKPQSPLLKRFLKLLAEAAA